MTTRRWVVLVGAALGIGTAVLSARCIINYDQRALGLFLAVVSVISFVVAAWFAASVVEKPWFWDFVDVVGLWVLTTLFVVLLGALAVHFVHRRSWEIRWSAAIGVAIVAGAIAALVPWLASNVTHLLLVAIRNVWTQIRLSWQSREGGDVAVGEPERRAMAPRLHALVDRTAKWRYRPSGRRFWTCVAMAAFGMFGSLVAQASFAWAGSSDQKADVYGPLLGWTLGSIVGWLLAALALKPPEAPRSARHFSHVFALAAIAVLGMFSLFSLLATHRARHALFAHPDGPAYGAADMHESNLTGQQAVARFRPALRFTADEPWLPTSVAWYTDDRHTHVALPPACVNKQGIPCRIDNRPNCDLVDSRCVPRGDPKHSVVYAFVDDDVKDEMPPRSNYASVNRVVQYWIFYNYDAFDRGVVRQWHQSDWEQISVGLASGVPKFVAYSSHCFGTWLPWENVRVEDGTHPLDWVAEGTHANYPRPYDAPLRGGRCPTFDPPKNFGLAGLAYGLIEAGGSLEVPVDLAAGLTDRIGNVPQHVRAVWIPCPSCSKLAFAGTWGRDNNISFFHLKPQKTGAPDSPTAHAEWQRPGPAILCSDKWFRPDKSIERHYRIAKRSCDLVTGVPRFRTTGVYCFTQGRGSDLQLKCWRPDTGETRHLGAAKGSKAGRGSNVYAKGFTPESDYELLEPGQQFQLSCDEDRDGKLSNCQPTADDSTGVVVFTCAATADAVDCRNRYSGRFAIPSAATR